MVGTIASWDTLAPSLKGQLLQESLSIGSAGSANNSLANKESLFFLYAFFFSY